MIKITASFYKKTFKQIKNKRGKLAKFLKHSVPKSRTCGESNHKCEMCGRTGAHISLYGLNLCRHCFRENAQKLGFNKYN